MQSPDPNQTADDEGHPLARRIRRLSLHLIPVASPLTGPSQLELLSCVARAKLNVDIPLLSEYMRGKHRGIQDKVYDYFNSRPDLLTPVEISKDDHRQLCMRQLMGLVREAGIRPFKYVADDPSMYFAILEAVGSVDMSLGIKMGVQYRCVLCVFFPLFFLYFLFVLSSNIRLGLYDLNFWRNQFVLRYRFSFWSVNELIYHFRFTCNPFSTRSYWNFTYRTDCLVE